MVHFFSNQDVVDFVDAVCRDLEAAGFRESARRLADVSGAVYTTGSEWLGEIQSAVIELRAEHRLPADLDARLKRLLVPGYAERVARRQAWEVTFYASCVLLLLTALAGLGVLTLEDSSQFVGFLVAAFLAVIVLLWIAVRKISVCPGCGLRSQRPTLPWCPFCGMRRYAGSPPPQVKPVPGEAPSPALECPSCRKPPGGRSRYGRPHSSEGRFCGHCGARLPHGR
jgi:hypothetical protein